MRFILNKNRLYISILQSDTNVNGFIFNIYSINNFGDPSLLIYFPFKNVNQIESKGNNLSITYAFENVFTKISISGIDLVSPANLNSNVGITPFSTYNYGLTITITLYSVDYASKNYDIINFGNSNSDNIIMKNINGKLQLRLGKGDLYYEVNDKFTFINLTTYQIVWTISLLGEWKIYINGNKIWNEVTDFYPKQIIRNNNYLLKFDVSSIGDIPSTGITNFRLYNKILTEEEILVLYNLPSTSLSSDRLSNGRYAIKNNDKYLSSNNLISFGNKVLDFIYSQSLFFLALIIILIIIYTRIQ